MTTRTEDRSKSHREGSWSSIASEPWVYRLVAVLTVAPILIAAVRAGLDGWIPVNDAAPTVLRAKYALTFHPSLVGMFTDASGWIGATTYFAGPWQLWWMSIPIRLLGFTWGPLLSMAALNIGGVLLAAWCVRRSLGRPSAIAALFAMGVLMWSIGISTTHSPVPMVMVGPAFAAFGIIAWVVATGDARSLPALALIANYLILDHLVMTILVPVIGAAALTCWLGFTLRSRRAPEAWLVRKRRSLHSVAFAAVVTVVMWLPPIVQELTHNPGNLTNLAHAAGAQPDSSTTLSTAIAGFTSLFMFPRFWLRGSTTSSFVAGHGTAPSLSAQVLVAVILVALLGLCFVLAVRNRDRGSFAITVLAVVTAVVTVFNLSHSLGKSGRTVRYFLSTWPAAMFITFAIGYTLSRVLRGRLLGLASLSILPLSLALSVATVVSQPLESASTDGTVHQRQRSRLINDRVLAELDADKSKQALVALDTPRAATYPYITGLAVALDQARIPFCVAKLSQLDGSPIPECKGQTVTSTVGFRKLYRSELKEVGTARLMTVPLDAVDPDQACNGHERRTWSRLTGMVRARAHDLALAGKQLSLTDAYITAVHKETDPGAGRDVLLKPGFLADPGSLALDAHVRRAFAEYIHVADESTRTRFTVLPGVTDSELLQWADLERRCDRKMLVVIIHTEK